MTRSWKRGQAFLILGGCRDSQKERDEGLYTTITKDETKEDGQGKETKLDDGNESSSGRNESYLILPLDPNQNPTTS